MGMEFQFYKKRVQRLGYTAMWMLWMPSEHCSEKWPRWQIWCYIGFTMKTIQSANTLKTNFNNSWFAIKGDGELLSTSYFCFLNYFYKELSFIKTFSNKHFVSFSPVSSSSSLPPLCPLSPVTSLLRSRDFRLPTFFMPIPLHLLASPI